MASRPLDVAYASCARRARAHYENFPVASLLLPAAMRPHVAAVYAFARVADDFADEGARSAAERHRLLDLWRARLEAAAAGAEQAPPRPGEPADAAAIFDALGATLRAHRLPVALFADLIDAFRQDVAVSRYETWDDLFDYCRRSANPVGRLVLRIGGHDDARLDAASDAICTALQLTNFWQDVASDHARGRIYVPREVLRAYGAREEDAGRAPLPAEWRAALAAAVARTRQLFGAGRPLAGALRGRLAWDVRATWLGGTRILDRLARGGYDPVARRPRLGPGDGPWFLWQLTAWRR